MPALLSDAAQKGPILASTPGNLAKFDLGPAFSALRMRNGNLAFLATGANVRVEQYLDFFPQGRPAMGAGWMLELEVPLPPTPRATVVGHDEQFPIDNVMLG